MAAKAALATAGPSGAPPGSPIAGRRLGRLNDVDLDLRHLVDAQHLLADEVSLFDFAVLERNCAVKRGAQAEADAPHPGT